MNKLFAWVCDKFFRPKLDFRVRLLNVLATAGTGNQCVYGDCLDFYKWGTHQYDILRRRRGVAYVLLMYASRSGQYNRCYMLTIIGVFLILFPIMFFLSAGLHGRHALFLHLCSNFYCLYAGGKASHLDESAGACSKLAGFVHSRSFIRIV